MLSVRLKTPTLTVLTLISETVDSAPGLAEAQSATSSRRVIGAESPRAEPDLLVAHGVGEAQQPERRRRGGGRVEAGDRERHVAAVLDQERVLDDAVARAVAHLDDPVVGAGVGGRRRAQDGGRRRGGDVGGGAGDPETAAHDGSEHHGCYREVGDEALHRSRAPFGLVLSVLRDRPFESVSEAPSRHVGHTRGTTYRGRERSFTEQNRRGGRGAGGDHMRVIVVGAGVVGLTVAVRLLEDGHRVDVVARDLPLETTSAVAAAIWYPYRALPQDRVTAWAATTYAVFDALADTDPESGVRMGTRHRGFTSRQPDPWWRSAVPSLDRETSLPDGWAHGWTFSTPLVEMPVYLPWLAGRVTALGGTITRMNLKALPAGAELVGELLGDRVAPAGERPHGRARTGQVLYLEQTGLRPLVDRRVRGDRRTHLRRAPHPRHRGRRHRRAGGVEPHPVAGDGRGDPGAGHPDGPGAAGRAGDPAQGRRCAPCGRRSGSSARATSSTATATAVPA